MSFKVVLESGTGHGDDSENPDSETFEFETHAEASAFLMGIEKASELLDGWVDGWTEAKIVS